MGTRDEVLRRVNAFISSPNHEYSMVNRVDEQRRKRMLYVESRLETKLYENTEFLKTLKKKEDMF